MKTPVVKHHYCEPLFVYIPFSSKKTIQSGQDLIATSTMLLDLTWFGNVLYCKDVSDLRILGLVRLCAVNRENPPGVSKLGGVVGASRVNIPRRCRVSICTELASYLRNFQVTFPMGSSLPTTIVQRGAVKLQGSKRVAFCPRLRTGQPKWLWDVPVQPDRYTCKPRGADFATGAFGQAPGQHLLRWQMKSS